MDGRKQETNTEMTKIFRLLVRIILTCQLFTASSTLASPYGNLAPSRTIAGQAEFDEAMGQLKKDGTSDIKRVFDLLTLASTNKHPDAIGALGYLYANGIYVEKNDTKARSYFQEAVDLGSKDSRLNLGLFLVHGKGGAVDIKKGLSLLQEMTLEGHTQAALALGELYYTGDHSEKKEPDYAQAYSVLLPQAETGNSTAQNFIGVIIRDGRIGPKDSDSAQIWFEKAAWQGNSKACSNLAELWNYQSEERKCRIEALRWMIVADDLGDMVSRYHFSDIRPQLAKDEETTARELADVTLKNIKKHNQSIKADQ
jgi:TPR repeat protein